jgi:hypothetical protein
MTPEEATIESLKRWSHILLWVSILLPTFGALAAGARYYVERHEKRLSGAIAAAAIERAKEDAATARAESSESKAKTAPRRLSAEQRTTMLPALIRLKGCLVGVACRMMDGESCDYATELATFLLEAGCRVGAPIKTSLNDLPGYLAVVPYGNADPELAKLLVNAFAADGIPARLETIEVKSVGSWYDNAVHVIVGRKVP